ncbi:MAG: Phage gp6-like head-tail connector protein [Bacteroidetes bacterium ADurb.BinA104]|nr:MAG: Phage gp6-like head-tail connector protein [Bacteroidetes bacterium ADurb.BinA104]
MLVADVPLTAETATTGPGCVVRPTLEPVSLAEIKLHLRIDHSDEDEYLKAILIAAREYAETFTRRALLTQTHDICLQNWPDDDFIELPYGNLQSVTSVKYKDTDGTETTLVENTDYIVETNKENCGRVVLPYGVSWPSTVLYPSNPITVRFVCGWTKESDVPQTIKAAIKLICSDMYNLRETKTDRQIYENKAADNLLYSYKLWSF